MDKGQEPAVIIANFLVDTRVKLVVQCHRQFASSGAILRQI
jgi:hypothetical protein